MMQSILNQSKKAMLAFGLFATVATGISVPRPSHALMLIVDEIGILKPGSARDLFACIVLLPLCILDKEIPGSLINEQSLIDNGYSAEEIHNIRLGQQMFAQALEARTFQASPKLLNQPYLLSVEMERQIPNIPQTYLEFVKNN